MSKHSWRKQQAWPCWAVWSSGIAWRRIACLTALLRQRESSYCGYPKKGDNVGTAISRVRWTVRGLVVVVMAMLWLGGWMTRKLQVVMPCLAICSYWVVCARRMRMAHQHFFPVLGFNHKFPILFKMSKCLIFFSFETKKKSLQSVSLRIDVLIQESTVGGYEAGRCKLRIETRRTNRYYGGICGRLTFPRGYASPSSVY